MNVQVNREDIFGGKRKPSLNQALARGLQPYLGASCSTKNWLIEGGYPQLGHPCFCTLVIE
ncbi:hypothetical protein GCM10027347_54370 [Larkinella harenae]